MRVCAVILVALFAFVWACIDATSVKLEGPQCRTPVPIFRTDQTAAADSVPLGCPYGYIENGDTILVRP